MVDSSHHPPPKKKHVHRLKTLKKKCVQCYCAVGCLGSPRAVGSNPTVMCVQNNAQLVGPARGSGDYRMLEGSDFCRGDVGECLCDVKSNDNCRRNNINLNIRTQKSFSANSSSSRHSFYSNMKLVTIILAMVSIACVSGDSCRYAGIDRRHTMCIFMPRQCPGKMLIKTGDVTCREKERILTKHNMLRQEVALGQVRGQPAALNMRTMVWDDELAMVAQRWADQCMPGHDGSRNVVRFAAGQNVAAVWTYERDEGSTPDFETQVEAWFMEVEQHGFSKSSVDPFRFSKPTGHYTQLVWADTYLVGCGYTYYHDAGGNGYTKLYVCNYGPGGNIVGGSMYKVGYPGQPYCVGNGLRPSTDYQGLCEEDGVNYKSMCSMGGSSMFHKPKTSSLMMLMEGNSVDDYHHHSHSHPTSPMDVMHPDPPHMEMHSVHSSMMGHSSALHHQQGHMMLPPPPPPPNFRQHMPRSEHAGDVLMKTIQAPFVGLVNALNPWNIINRFKLN